MTKPPVRAAIYCRLSYAPDGSLEKVERQEGDCRDVGARLGWSVSDGHVFSDNNRSAWQRTRRRPQWDAMLDAIDRGEVDAVIVYHGDRLIRQPYDLEKLLNISDSKGVRLASPSGTRNLDSPDDRFVLRIEAAQACRESDNTSRRVRRGWANRAQRGYPSGGGRRPFGFERDLITRRESECEILAEAAARLLAGQSEGGIVRWMNTCSTTTEGNPWTRRSVRNLMEAPRIAGLVAHDRNLYPAVWEPIISVDDWHALNAMFRERAKILGYPGRERKYLLSGVATCATGHSLYTKPSGGRNRPTARIYWCKVTKCPTSVGRAVELLDAYVEGQAVALLQHPDFVAEVSAAEPSVAGEVAELERRRAEVEAIVADLADHPDANAALLLKSVASFDRKIHELRARAAVGERKRLLRRVAGVSREEWGEMPVDTRSTIVRALFRVTVLPTSRRGPGFDPGAVRVERLPLD